MRPDEILRHCVLEHEGHFILVESHGGVVGGHYSGRENAQNIL